MIYPIVAAVGQSCTLSIVLSSCRLVPVICGMGSISDTQHVDLNVRIGWYIHFNHKGSCITAQIGVNLWTRYGREHAAATQQNYGVWWGDKRYAPIKAVSYSSSHTGVDLQAAAARRLDCCWAAGS